VLLLLLLLLAIAQKRAVLRCLWATNGLQRINDRLRVLLLLLQRCRDGSVVLKQQISAEQSRGAEAARLSAQHGART
jgi:hypothetical protein